ncbi:MAG: hypothetical protein ACYTFI_24365 [Planctomycetota bacterium]
MRYSYCWDVTPEVIFAASRHPAANPWVDRYVAIRGDTSTMQEETGLCMVHTDGTRGGTTFRYPMQTVYLTPPSGRASPAEEPRRNATSVRHGRVRLGPIRDLFLDAGASRFTGASIAGLVVGAMGVFVFTVALRHWLNQWRAFCVQTAETVE